MTDLAYMAIALVVLALAIALNAHDSDYSLDPDSQAEVVARAGVDSQCVEGGAGLCTPCDMSGYDLFSASRGSGSGYVTQGEPSVEETLDHGLELVGASPTHLASG